MDNRSDIWRGVDAIKARFVALSDTVWAIPEVCYTEARSAAEHLAELRHQNFRITEHVAGIPTALLGEAGEGGPVIAFLGEYDALPGLSQEAGVAEFRPTEPGIRRPSQPAHFAGSASVTEGDCRESSMSPKNQPTGRARHTRGALPRLEVETSLPTAQSEPASSVRRSIRPRSCDAGPA